MKKFVFAALLALTLVMALPAFAQDGNSCSPGVNYLKQGWEQLEAEDFNSALASFNCGVQLTPENAHLYYGIAEVYCDTGEVEKAIEMFQQAVTVDPSYSMAWNTLGWALYNHGDDALALDALEQAIEVDPQNPYPYNNRGLIYMKQGDLALARADFQQAIDLGLEQPWAETNLFNLRYAE
ncbi:MAG: tetratricopeptide repeat protein [Anaerolineae bacterium]|nr:tetratricopeptide repeat protein [Anaerolineae bacterium]